MQRKELYGSLILFIVLIATCVGAIWALVHLVGLEASLIWGALIGGIAWIIRYTMEQRREYQRLLAEKKREQYFRFLDIVNQFIESSRQGSESTGSAATSTATPDNTNPSPEQLRTWSLQLTLLASDDVVKAWNAIKRKGYTGQTSQETVSMMQDWGNLWLAMRRDCGHPDTRLTRSDMLASVVNDIETYRQNVDVQNQAGK